MTYNFGSETHWIKRFTTQRAKRTKNLTEELEIEDKRFSLVRKDFNEKSNQVIGEFDLEIKKLEEFSLVVNGVLEYYDRFSKKGWDHSKINDEEIQNAKKAEEAFDFIMHSDKEIEREFSENLMYFFESSLRGVRREITTLLGEFNLSGAMDYERRYKLDTKRKTFRRTLEITNEKIENTKKSLKNERKRLQKEYLERKNNSNDMKGAKMMSCARESTTELERVCSDIRSHQEISEIERLIYRGLFDLETTGFMNTGEFSLYNRKDIDEFLAIMVAMNTITKKDAVDILVHINKPILSEKAENEERTKPNEKIKKSIIYSILGDARAAIRITRNNPPLLSMNRERFEEYASKLKQVYGLVVKFDQHDNINPIDKPELFSDVPSLLDLEKRLLKLPEDDTRIKNLVDLTRDVKNEGYDPDLVKALIMAFKPQTKKFIGNAYVSKKVVHNNVRPLLDLEKRKDVEHYIDIMVKQGVILTKKSGDGVFSLNPHLDDIKDSSLMRMVAYYLPK